MALKYAEKLERIGKTGHVTFIDGAPVMTRIFAQQHYKEHSEEYIRNHFVGNLLTSLLTKQNSEYVNNVLDLPTWDEKINAVVEIISSQNIYSKEYLMLMLNALVNRTRMILNLPDKLCMLETTTATLIRPVTSAVGDLKENYELDLNFKTDVEVKCVEGNHFSILESPQVLEILNKIHSSLEN